MNKAFLLAFTVAGFVACGTAANAEDPAGGGTAANAPISTTGSNPDTIVCHVSPPVVGTRLGATRHCKTQREWDQERADAQKALNDAQTHTFTSGK